MDAHADFREAEFVKIINRIFHEEEAAVYDASHPEIFQFEPATWHELARFLPSDKKGLRLLDVGTGTGFVPETLSAHLGKEDTVVLTDLSKTMLELARSKLLPKKVPRFLFVVADAERLPIVGEQFDVVTANSVLHHFPNTSAFLAEVDRVLRLGGLLIIAHEPNQAFFGNPFLHACQWIVWKYNGLRLRLRWRKAMGEKPASIYANVNRRLRELGLIAKNLSLHEIQSYVDFHVPTASGRVCPSKGFNFQALREHHLPGYTGVFSRTYNYLDIAGPPSRIIALIQKALGIVFPRSGYLTAVVYKKTMRENPPA